MATLVSQAFSLLVLLVLGDAALGSLIGNVKEKSCSEGLGICGRDCHERCQARHAGDGEGSCDYIINPPLCTCYYVCPDPVPPPVCFNVIGVCSESCGSECCDEYCVQTYNMNQGHGSCVQNGTLSLCQCHYYC